jgi:hypothetical protein
VGADGRRQILAFAATLQVLDLLRAMERDTDGVDAAMKVRSVLRHGVVYSRSLSSQTTIRHHVKMFLFSSDLTVYRGTKGELKKAVLVCAPLCSH